jgi:hypothetical protein
MLKGFSFAVAIMLAATTSLHSLAAAGDLVELCHHPPGNPDHHVMIVVGTAAVPAHLAHGDHLHQMCPGHEQ